MVASREDSVARTATPPRTRVATCCGWLRPTTRSASTTHGCTATVGAGVSIDELLEVIVPRGYFVPVTPGTRFVTIGGAIASDIHGKNHHADGSFGDHVVRIRLMLADTTIVELGPDRDPELFWATIGGMGLTGVVIDATFRLIPIETSRMSVETRRIDHLDEIMARMADGDADVKYSVAWIDLLAKGRHLGRGVLTNAEHATAAQLGVREATDPLAYACRQLVAVPRIVPSSGVINRLSVAAFNELWYRKAPRQRQGELQSIPAYFHPLDLVGDWNRVYGRRGLLQYQFVVPFGAEQVLRRVIERISASALPIFLTVLKRFGGSNPGHLSFPIGRLDTRHRRAGRPGRTRRAAARSRRAGARRRGSPLPGKGLSNQPGCDSARLPAPRGVVGDPSPRRPGRRVGE